MDIIHSITQWIHGSLLWAINDFGYWAVFFGVMLENAGLPVPGETILLIAGFFSASGQLNLAGVMATAAVGAIVGDNIGFGIGQRYGRSILLRYGRYLFLTPARFERLDTYFMRYGDKTILVARFITGLRVFAAIFAGASQMPWRRFLVYNALGAVLWATVIASLGYLFGESWPLLEKWLGRTGMVMLVAGILAAAIIWRVRAHSREPDPESSSLTP